MQYESLVGQRVIKKSLRPFKSTFQINTVKSVVNHPQLNIPAFTFEEDASYVECRRCESAVLHILTEIAR